MCLHDKNALCFKYHHQSGQEAGCDDTTVFCDVCIMWPAPVKETFAWSLAIKHLKAKK